MFCVDRLTLREIRLALKEPFRITSGIEHERRILLLELTDRDGASAWSECVTLPRPNYSPETIDTAWLAIREWLAPRVLGRRFTSPTAVHAVLEENVRGHNLAKAALEMGCWGLEATIRHPPLSILLGGTRDRVPTGISLGIQPTSPLLVERAQEAVAAGYVWRARTSGRRTISGAVTCGDDRRPGVRAWGAVRVREESHSRVPSSAKTGRA